MTGSRYHAVVRSGPMGKGLLFLLGTTLLAAAEETKTPTVVPERRPILLFLGDSLTAGYGLLPSEAFPALIEKKIREARLGFRVVTAGVSGDTSAGGRQRIASLLSPDVKVLFLELGGNDGLRGIPPRATRDNLEAIIRMAEGAKVQVVLAGMRMPPNYGEDYIRSFEQIYTDLAFAHKLPRVPFLLEGVAAREDKNLPDGIHPNKEGHELLAKTVWKVLEPVLATVTP